MTKIILNDSAGIQSKTPPVSKKRKNPSRKRCDLRRRNAYAAKMAVSCVKDPGASRRFVTPCRRLGTSRAGTEGATWWPAVAMEAGDSPVLSLDCIPQLDGGEEVDGGGEGGLDGGGSQNDEDSPNNDDEMNDDDEKQCDHDLKLETSEDRHTCTSCRKEKIELFSCVNCKYSFSLCASCYCFTTLGFKQPND